MYVVTHSHLANDAPSQNPPSSVNPHIFSNPKFLVGGYPYHHSQSSKQQGKKELHHILYATQYKCHRFCHMFQINAAVITLLETGLHISIRSFQGANYNTINF